MRSHEYKTTTRDWPTVILPTLAVLIGLAGILRSANHLGFLPSPPITAVPGATVLAHQSSAARAGLPGEIVLLGDSTCMMSVDAPMLEARLPGQSPVLNLGLIVWPGFEDYAELLSDHSSVARSDIKAVVILVTPTKLTLSRAAGDGPSLRQIGEQRNAPMTSLADSRSLAEWLSCDIIKRYLLSHLLVRPLEGRGEGAVFFGFPTEIDKYMTIHQGSLIELGSFKPSRTSEQWGLIPASDLEAQSKILRDAVPRGTKLIIGLTPMPESRSSTEERERRPVLLAVWNQYLKADGVLTNLPAKMPDIFFAGGGHLSPIGQKEFTAILAHELIPFLVKEK